MEKVIGADKSDLAENARIKCLACLPDAKVKEEAWTAITSSTETIYAREAKMAGFYSWE